jgi:hypothetical protein
MSRTLRSRTRFQIPNEGIIVAGLVALGVGLPVILGAASGALDISHNDDFNYRRIALGLLDTGRIELTGWSVMSLIGQLILVQPLLWVSSGDAWAFAATTALCTVVGIGASYHLVRRLVPPARTTLVLLTMLLFPGFLVYTTAFMTDVPALAAGMLCLALGAAALDRSGARRWLLLAGALAAGCFAFSIREFALAAPAAVLVFAGAGITGKRLGLLLVGVATLATCLAIHVVTANLPGQGSLSLGFSPWNLVQVRHAAATLGLVLAPTLVLALASRWRDWRSTDFAAGFLAGMVLFWDELQTAATTMTMPTLLLGNLIEPLGAPGGVAAGSRPILFGSPIWDMLNLVGLVAAILGVGVLFGVIGRWVRSGDLANPIALARWLRSTEGLLATFAILYGGGLIAFGLVGLVYDRYLWPLSVPIAALLLRPSTTSKGPVPSRAARIGTYGAIGILTAALAWTSSALLLNAFAFDAAGWRMGELAVERGFAPQTVDAGMAWVGYYATGVAQLGAQPTPSENWYDAIWPSFTPCAMVSSSMLDVPGFHLMAAEINAYRLFLFDGLQEPLYLYRIETPGCP